MTFKVIVAGSRDFNNYPLFKRKLDSLLEKKLPDVEIVSGGARGADKLGETYAQGSHLKCTVINAEWEKYGKKAGYLRNVAMALYADALVAFWDGKSKGTQHMITIATSKHLDVRVIRYHECPDPS